MRIIYNTNILPRHGDRIDMFDYIPCPVVNEVLLYPTLDTLKGVHAEDLKKNPNYPITMVDAIIYVRHA